MTHITIERAKLALADATQSAMTSHNSEGDQVICIKPHLWKQLREAIQALAAPTVQEPVQEPMQHYITPLMEQQMFDDWCPYKGNPDPRTVWSAAIDSANGLLLAASIRQRPRAPKVVDCHATGVCVQSGLRAEKPAALLTDGVLVSLTILEAAEASLGSFCSDHGWSDKDMQSMDNLSAYIARHKAAHSITKGGAA
jgi:hypothetical protein